MKWTVRQLKQGVFFTGWKNAALSIILAVSVYFLSGVYDILNHGPARLFLETPLDRMIPVVGIFVIPYISLDFYVYATLILFILFRNKYFQSAAFSMVTIFLVSYFFYYFLQSYVERPVLTGNDMLTRLIRDVYAHDKPYNDFPSLHTSISAVLALHWLRLDRRIGIPVSVWTALIVLSTLFVRQHYIADALFGLALSFGAAWVFVRAFGIAKHEVR